MKQIVTHKSPDLDAIGSTWLLLRFLRGWEDAKIELVSAGEKLPGNYENEGAVIEIVDGVETIHVDTGLGKLDHHQTQDANTCGASLTLEHILSDNSAPLHGRDTEREAVKRIVEMIVDDDHFQEYYYPEPSHDRYDFSLRGILQGYKMMYQQDDEKVIDLILQDFDALLHSFKIKIWAENEIKEKGIDFETKWGKGLGVETLNDGVLKLAQLQGYTIVVRKDPNQGFVRIKARPAKRNSGEKEVIDLTPVYEAITEQDPESSWFLHVSKKMLLNGSSKNPDMRGSDLSLREVIDTITATCGQ